MKRFPIEAHDLDTRTNKMHGPNPRGFAMTRCTDRVPVSRAQLLLQYLLALEFGAAELEQSPASVAQRQKSSGTGPSSITITTSSVPKNRQQEATKTKARAARRIQS
jgi:hypothetical protein